MRSSRYGRDWDDLAELDPLWAILSAPDKRYGRWGRAEFFETGRLEIDSVLEGARELGRPARWERCLDFGCGVGRTSRALAGQFASCEGVDISAEMVALARELNSDVANCSFDRTELDRFPADAFDLVYSSFVLQHVPDRATAEAYIAEFLRIARPDGLVVFQLPERLPWQRRLQLRPRAYAALRAAGLSRDWLYRVARLHPIRMLALPRPEVERAVRVARGSVGKVVQVAEGDQLAGLRYFVVP